MKSPCRKASSCVGVKRIKTVSKDPQPLSEQPLPRGSIPATPRGGGACWQSLGRCPVPHFIFKTSSECTPKLSLCFLPPKPRQAPPSQDPPQLCPPSLHHPSLGVTESRAGRCRAKQAARCRSLRCASPDSELLFGQQELPLRRAAGVWHFPEEL